MKSDEAWYASHAWNPAFFAETATFAEVCAQRGWSAPDVVVMPLGHGTLFLDAYRGFVDLLNAGWIDSLPRLLVHRRLDMHQSHVSFMTFQQRRQK